MTLSRGVGFEVECRCELRRRSSWAFVLLQGFGGAELKALPCLGLGYEGSLSLQ